MRRRCRSWPGTARWRGSGPSERSRSSVDAPDDYYAAATVGEARLLLGDVDGARAALGQAADRHQGDYGALATTRRQLRLICRVDEASTRRPRGPRRPVGDPLLRAPPRRRRVRRRALCAPRLRRRWRSAIAEVVRRHPPGYAYGSLASGADILWAEALLAAGSELHVILPFAREEFIERSVTPSGPGWAERFDSLPPGPRRRCSLRPTTRSSATTSSSGTAPSSRWASRCSGRATSTPRSGSSRCGTANRRRRRGHRDRYRDLAAARPRATTVITPSADGTRLGATSEASPATVARPTGASPERPATARSADPDGGRVVRAMLFGDVKGFSKLTDEQLPSFSRLVLGAFADVLERYRADIWHTQHVGRRRLRRALRRDHGRRAARSTSRTRSPASISRAAGSRRRSRCGSAATSGRCSRPTTRCSIELGFMGSHVSRTARIEPVTPPGDRVRDGAVRGRARARRPHRVRL